LNVEAALGELLEGAGTQFDPAVVAAVVELELQPA
jgi:HD-GYP domain-containing protein (c-di-GMP phosphodiesterase class II)